MTKDLTNEVISVENWNTPRERASLMLDGDEFNTLTIVKKTALPKSKSKGFYAYDMNTGSKTITRYLFDGEVNGFAREAGAFEEVKDGEDLTGYTIDYSKMPLNCEAGQLSLV